MRKSLVTASALAVTVLALSSLLPLKFAFAGDQLTITAGGGALQASQRKALFQPFSKATGIKITEDEYNFEVDKIRAMVETKTVSWDVVDINQSAAIKLCDSGILEPLDWKKLGLDQAKFLGDSRYECGVPTHVSATVVAYDKDKLPNGPKAVADLFDLEKFPGKRGLYKDPYTNLEWALIADGVSKKDVYNVLRTSEGVERALKKLDTIKKDVIWWTSGAQPPQLLADGQVVMTSAWNGRIYDAVKNSGKHFEIMWDAQIATFNLWAIPKGTPHRDEAYKFIGFAASPHSQAEMTRFIAYGTGNTEAAKLIDPTILADLPTAPEHAVQAIDFDVLFWIENGDQLRQRFTAWLAK
ncbi:ABC transporter substrate-binding protein [Bradyrhizobium sp. CW1]|uniref:ABC transporter substrate-binding protein n=1 Tax=Bradyrhizobium sp. CW1 TaxID=2782686 RepID=UPI001FFF0CB6|nr:ABC transporter substrate-binding protein [Bradyrhizobium sp. CW1]UPJ26369.1 ABC transporter substrate-binding protein [Bradyrhizobium sp. CW1]